MNKNKAVQDMECGELFIGTLADVNTLTASNEEWHYVVDRPTQAILGLKDCELLNLIQRVEELENNCKTENDFLKKYSDVFTSSEIGCLVDTVSRAYLSLQDEDSLEEELKVQVILPMSTERSEPSCVTRRREILRYEYIDEHDSRRLDHK